MPSLRSWLGAVAGVLLALPPLAARAAPAHDRWFVTSDGVRLHYLEAGPDSAPPILFVPGWTMPAWIFDKQIDALSARYHVLALDPRGQGRSDIPATGYEPVRRGRDIAELIDRACAEPVVIVGWSLGVLDTLSYVRQAGDRRLAGLVLVDNSIGEGPPPAPRRTANGPRREAERAQARRAFVAGMFASDPGEAYLARLTADSLRMPASAEQALLSYPVPRQDWRGAILMSARPVLYVIRPRFREQGEALLAERPRARVEVFETAGHALFVDEPDRFNALIEGFMARDVQPAATR
ncbi:MAG: alpha/beta hydrolase [Caulobacteraceae bacterium]|nr:alpha/beta hydrolase [Caulobacteraceae bacterium]